MNSTFTVSGTLTSWRDNPDKYKGAANDLYSDDDSIEVIAFLRVEETLTSTNRGIEVKYQKDSTGKYAWNYYNYYTRETESQAETADYELNPKFIPVLSGDSLQSFHTFVPKVVGLLLTYPKGLKRIIIVKIRNLKFDDGFYIDF